MPFPEIPSIFATLDSLVIAHFGPGASLLHGNAGLKRLCADECQHAWYLFTQPRLADLLNAPPDADGAVYRGRLTVGEPTGTMRTLSGSVFVSNEETLVVAGYDIEEFELNSTRLLELNGELDTAHRELVRTNRELLRREQVIRELSLTDPLTGIGNRRHLDDSLATEMARAQRYNQPLSLVMLDIDHFKRINDSAGHEAGDLVLQGIGALLREFRRQSDSVSRLGGEEFVLLMPGATLDQAAAAAERLRQLVAARALGGPPGITVSLGVAALDGDDSGRSLLARADAALYRAKSSGRDRVVRAEPGDPECKQPL